MDSPDLEDASAHIPVGDPIYDRDFWWAYVANLLLVSANAINYRFAEFVVKLGGSEQDAGWIAGAALYVSLAVRLWLGTALDHFGVGRTWRVSALLYVASTASLFAIHDLGPAIYAVRIVMAIAIAGMFACSLSHVQGRTPVLRRTEVIATLGSSGFLGMIVGAQVVDYEFLWLRGTGWLFPVMFGSMTLLGAGYLAIVFKLTDGHVHVIPEHTPPAWTLLRAHWPGMVLIGAFMIGTGLTVTTVFLTRFATERHLSGIRMFFTIYAAAAFVIRIASRNWHRHTGRHWLIVLGLVGHAISQWLLTGVHDDWQFIAPALFGGLGHAMLFPCVVSIGAGVFPPQFRGTGTTLTLGFMDFGTAVTSPLFGRIIDGYGFTAMLSTAAGMFAAAALVYAIWSLRHPDHEES